MVLCCCVVVLVGLQDHKQKVSGNGRRYGGAIERGYLKVPREEK
jgi:hypothetical protein